MKKNLCKSLMMITIVTSIVLTGCGKQNFTETASATEVLHVEDTVKEVDTLLPEDSSKPVVTEIAETAVVEIAAPKPADAVTPKPVVTETSKPAETVAPKSAETATSKPVETEASKPAETAAPKPAETEAPKPAETVAPKPAETETPKLVETATPKPVESATPKPVETPVPTQEPTPTPTAAPCNHNYVKKYWPAEPTCSNSGDYAMVCSICGAVGETGTDPKLDHTPVTVDDPSATYCDEHGVKVTTCSVCGTELSREGYNGSEHDWVTGTYEAWDEELEEVVTKENTYCSRCGTQQ